MFESLLTGRNLMIVGVLVAVVLYMLMSKSSGPKPRKDRRQGVLVFRPKSVESVVGENVGGAVYLPGIGGVAATPDLVTVRSGRIWRIPRNGNVEALRRRTEVYVSRYGDGTPMDLAAGPKKGYMSSPVGLGGYVERFNASTQIVREDTIKEGSAATFLGGRMILGMLVFGALAGAAQFGYVGLAWYLRTHGYELPVK